MNLAKKCLLLLLPLLAVACNPKSQEQTAETTPPIDRETMVDLMADCFILEGVIYYQNVDSLQRAKTQEKYSELFDFYDVTVEDFQQSVNFYLKEKETSKLFLEDVNLKILEKRDSAITQ